MASGMDEKFFVEDTVSLRKDPSFIAVVEQTWRDIDSLGFTRPDDWIPHSGVSDDALWELFQDGRPPNGHVIVRFIEPFAGCTLVEEKSLILKDRGLVIGDVVKRNPSDIESGYVIKTSIQCTLRPIYTGLPWSQSNPWPYKSEESRVTVPEEELTFNEYNAGDYVMYKGWVGEVTDFHEQITLKLENGSVVRVKNSDELEATFYQATFGQAPPRSYKKPTLTRYLKEARAELTTHSDPQRRGPIDIFYPGQQVFTKKSNLRLGNWVIGSYDPSVPPQGIVVEVRIVELTVHWLTRNFFDSDQPITEDPPEVLDSDQINDIRLYNRNNVSSSPESVSNKYGSRQGNDIGVGDLVKFRDVAGAAVKYAENSPKAAETGVFRRIPRQATLGFDMNYFFVANTSQVASVQWQSGQITEVLATHLIPYLQVDDHDLWVGELISLKSAETKQSDGIINLGKVGVVQSVDARERLATVRWFETPKVGVFEEQLTVMVPGSQMGKLSEETSQVSVYEVIAYPALTCRRGDLVMIAPNESSHVAHHAQVYNSLGIELPSATRNVLENTTPSEETTRNAAAATPVESSLGWFGEVVDLGLDGMLTVRLGGLDKVEDIKVPVTRVSVIVGGDDGGLASNLQSFIDDDDDYDSDEMSDGTDEDVVIEEVITYEGGERLDNGENSDDWTDEAEDDSDVDMDGDHSKTDETTPIHKDAKMEDLTSPLPATKTSSRPTIEAHAEYAFSSFGNMPSPFEILDEPPASDHHFLSQQPTLTAALLRRIQKEHSILSNALPSGIWVRTWHERPDLLRILIVGPRNTPYELAPFVLDLHFNDDFPRSPPEVYFHSWTFGIGRINPNLYEDGKVCLSVLGTWPEGDRGEGWSKDKSSVLQVLVSLMGLVLVKEPYYNEAGFEALVGTEETVHPSRIYSEKAYCMAKGFIAFALSHGVPALDPIISWLYSNSDGPRLLKLAVEESKAKVARGKNGGEEEDRLSAGAEVLMTRHLGYLEGRLKEVEMWDVD